MTTKAEKTAARIKRVAEGLELPALLISVANTAGVCSTTARNYLTRLGYRVSCGFVYGKEKP